MKYFLLIAGDSYYPSRGTGDWISTFFSEKEALDKIVFVKHYRTITKGKKKGEQELTHTTYNIMNTNYDWYDIIDLREWIN